MTSTSRPPAFPESPCSAPSEQRARTGSPRRRPRPTRCTSSRSSRRERVARREGRTPAPRARSPCPRRAMRGPDVRRGLRREGRRRRPPSARRLRRRGRRQVRRSRATAAANARVGRRPCARPPARRWSRVPPDGCLRARRRSPAGAPIHAASGAQRALPARPLPAQRTPRQPQSPSLLQHLLATRTVFGASPLGYGRVNSRFATIPRPVGGCLVARRPFCVRKSTDRQ